MMKVLVQLATVCLLAHLAVAVKGPVAEPVCDVVCPPDNPIVQNWHLPYTGHCELFCHCANDGNWKKECPAGLEFNPTLQVCDWPYAAGCTQESSSSTDSSTSESSTVDSSTNTTPDLSSSTESSTETTSEASSSTESSTESTSESTTASPPTTPNADGCDHETCNIDECKFYDNYLNCQWFCECDKGVVTVHKCADGLYWNDDTHNCDWESNVHCPLDGCQDFECHSNICDRGPNTLDCNLYCDCHHGNKTVGHCAPGLFFNPDTKQCDKEENVHCGGSTVDTTTPVPPTSASTTEVSSTTPESTTDEPSTTDPPTSESTTKAPTTLPPTTPSGVKTCDDICPDVFPIEANNHLFPGDCKKFCHCANDGNWLKDCPPGLEFNAVLQVCDWPYNANCVPTV